MPQREARKFGRVTLGRRYVKLLHYLSSAVKRQGRRPAGCRTMECCWSQLIAYPQNGLCS